MQLRAGINPSCPAVTKLLQSEGVEFDDHDRANPNQRITTADFAQLLAIELDNAAPALSVDGGGRDLFFAQLTQHQHRRSSMA